MPRAALLALISVSVAVAGCGGGSASGGEEPASAVPANAVAYIEATVRPEGDQREDALAAAAKLLDTEKPQWKIDGFVAKAFAKASEDGVTYDYDKDVKPWLGQKVGLWISPASGGEEDDFRGAVIMATTDADAAKESVEETKGNDKSYEGVDYVVDGEGFASGIVDDFAVFGSEAEFKRTVEAAKGDGLDADAKYRKATSVLDDERLGTFYVDMKAILDEAVRRDPEVGQQLEQARQLFPLDQVGPITGQFLADGERLAVDVSAQVPEDTLPGGLGALTGGGSTPLLGELPGDSWLALGSPEFGASMKTIYGQAAGALGGAALRQQLRSELGIDLDEDVFSWIGDVAFFVRGTTKRSADGGVVIEVTDSDKAKAAFGKLVGLAQSRANVPAKPTRIEGADTAFEASMPGSPRPIVAARSDDRVVIAFGREAAAAAFGSGDRLSDSELYGEAKSVLGDEVEPGLLLSMPAVLELARSSGETDEDFKEAEPYLDAFSVIAGGSGREGDRAHSRFAGGLK